MIGSLALLWLVAPASPALAAPEYQVHSHAPSHVNPGESFSYFLDVENIGDTATSGTITLRVTFPTGITGGAFGTTGNFNACPGSSFPTLVSTVTCTRTLSLPANAGRGSITTSERRIVAAVDPAAPLGDATISVEVFGGGATEATVYTDELVIGPSPGFGIFEFGGLVSDAAGEPATQAGAHPAELTTLITFNTSGTDQTNLGGAIPPADARNVEVELPPGFIGNPEATPTRCSQEAFASGGGAVAPPCPPSSQVGIARAWGFGGGLTPRVSTFGIFNMEPPPNVPAQFAFRINGVPTFINAGVRTGGDYGLTALVRNIPKTQLIKTEITLWGFPSDSRYDALRGSCLTSLAVDSCPSGAPRSPFLTNPTKCAAGPLTTRLDVNTWQSPGVFSGASFDHDMNGVPMAVEGCDKLSFDPSITVQPVDTRPDVGSGYEIELRVPQNENPDGLASAHLKRARVTFPEGVSVSPSSVHGLEACSSAQIALDSGTEPTCPEASRIGSLEVETPLLPDPMTGHVYVAKQGDNPFNSLFAIYLVARGPGVLLKLPGHVEADPATGRLTATFDNNPQVPFSLLRMRLKGGPTAPLANPPACGTKTVTTAMTPWSGGQPATPSATFAIDCPGLSGFAPAFNAGTTTPTGGRFSPFAVRIDRADGQEYINGLTIEMPPGLIGKLKDIPLCPDAAAAAGTCGVESRVGTATVGAGPGPNPYFLEGSVSLTGPYKGAPYGLAVAVRAIAGPYDLGMVVVRQAIFVDRTDAHLTVVSDPLPTIVEGVPLRLRSLNVDIDRPGFVMNPTSCGEKQITATMTSASGSVSRAAQRFQVGDCQALPLRPRLALRLTGRRQAGDGKHPGLRAVLRQGSGQANLKAVAVKLPLSLALDPDNARALCEFADGLRVDCPRSSIIGRARAFTPVLNRPLEGPAYFVKGVRVHPRTGRLIRTLPTLLMPLRGEIALDLRARSSVRDGHLVTTFPLIPDAPVSRFELTLKGGRNGILVVTNKRHLCRGRHVADVETDGHNGKRADRSVRLKTPCIQRRGARRAVRK